jgi:hypothetical protein
VLEGTDPPPYCFLSVFEFENQTDNLLEVMVWLPICHQEEICAFHTSSTVVEEAVVKPLVLYVKINIRMCRKDPGIPCRDRPRAFPEVPRDMKISICYSA